MRGILIGALVPLDTGRLLSDLCYYNFLRIFRTTSSSSPINPHDDVFSSPTITQTSGFISAHSLQTASRPQASSSICYGPSGLSQFGVSIAMSAKISQERDLEWTNNVDKALYALIHYFNKHCLICFLHNQHEYLYHRTSGCPSQLLSKSNDEFYTFCTSFNVPDKMCYGCGLHTGIRI